MDTADDSTLHLVDDRGEILGSVQVESQMLESLRGYLQACSGTGYHAQLQSTFETSIKTAIQQLLPYHLRQPSEAQVNYAVGIARALGVPVPPEALSQRWAMHEFLDCYVPAFKEKQASRNPSVSQKRPKTSGQSTDQELAERTEVDGSQPTELGSFECKR